MVGEIEVCVRSIDDSFVIFCFYFVCEFILVWPYNTYDQVLEQMCRKFSIKSVN